MSAEVLIIDGDAAYVKAFSEELTKKYPEVSVNSASSAREAMSLLAGTTPSAIVIEARLPDMSGVELLGVVRESKRLKNIPVFIASARYTEPADRTEALLAGASAFFVKPLNVSDLCREIEYFSGVK